EMLARQIIPACVAYSNKVAEGVAVKKSIGVDAPAELDMVRALTALTGELYSRQAALQQAVDTVPADGDVLAGAEYYRDEVIPAMNAARAVADKLETMVGETDWPMPTYGKMLFYV
ncbi:MAG: glutamine synthetase type III, partial [Butyricicoccus sp.]